MEWIENIHDIDTVGMASDVNNIARIRERFGYACSYTGFGEELRFVTPESGADRNKKTIVRRNFFKLERHEK